MGNSSNYFIVITNYKQLLHCPHHEINVFRLQTTINDNIPAGIYCSKLTMEIRQQCVKYVQSNKDIKKM